MDLEQSAETGRRSIVLKLAVSSVAPERQYDVPKRTLIFTHIPRTAGTTLDRIFRSIASIKKVSSRRAMGTIYGQYLGKEKGDALDFLTNPSKDLSALKYIFGHVPYGIHEKLGLRDVAYGVVLRNPRNRIMSQIRLGLKETYNISTDDIAALIKDKNLVDNCQVRMIAGCTDGTEKCDDKMLDKALENLKENYSYVGFQESLPIFIHTLIESEGWPSVMFLDRHKSRQATLNVSSTEISKLQDYIRLDADLYSEAQKLVGNYELGQNTNRLNDYIQGKGEKNLADVVVGVMPDTLMGHSVVQLSPDLFPRFHKRMMDKGLAIEEI